MREGEKKENSKILGAGEVYHFVNKLVTNRLSRQIDRQIDREVDKQKKKNALLINSSLITANIILDELTEG